MKDEGKHTELIDLAIKKHTQEANEKELQRLTALIEADSALQQVYDEYIKTWGLTGKVRGISSDEIQQEWQRLDQAIERLPKSKPAFSIFKIAAVITLLILSSTFLYQYVFDPNHTEIIASKISEQPLEDGSLITLSKGTKLSYTQSFNQEKREVALDGEAFFDVAKNADKPFVVHAQNTEIEVLGTSFNVKAVKADQITEVVVVTGKVQVKHADNTVLLSPGEKAVVHNKSGKLFKVANDDPNFQAWRTKKFVFDDLPLAAVIALLDEVYQTPIYLANNNLSECPVTVSFDNQPLDAILEVLTSTLDLTTNQTNKGLAIDGEGCE